MKCSLFQSAPVRILVDSRSSDCFEREFGMSRPLMSRAAARRPLALDRVGLAGG
jgi:hypothetical protein